MRVVVVATWGLPLMWRRVKYYVPKLPSKLCGRPSDYFEVALEREGYSSTAVVREALADHEVHVVVVGQESIVAKCRNAPGEPRDDKQKVDAEVCRLNGELHGRVASVEELRGEAEDRLRRYVELFLGRADVVVLPAVGWYEGYRFSGSLDNAGFFIVDEIYRRLEQLAPDAVVLDVTHGINYMPLFARQAVYMASKALYVRRGAPRCLLVVNSDPVTQDGQDAAINIVESVELEGTTLEEVLVDLAADKDITPLRLLRGAPREAVEAAGAVRRLVKDVAGRLGMLADALRLGLLMYFAQVGGDVRNLAESVNKAAEEARDAVLKASLERGGAWVYVVRRLAADPGLARLRILAEVLAWAHGEAQRCGAEDGFYKLNCLGDVADRMKLGVVAKTLLKYEIDSLSDKLKGWAEEGPRLACEALGESCKPCVADKRILIAHAGLAKALIDVARRGGELYVRLRRDCATVVETHLRKLRKTDGG
jgi:CRISPR-associated protein Csx1